MVMTRFARDCIVFSKIMDKFTTDTFCMMAFNEAEYIASNRFGLPDAMFEQSKYIKAEAIRFRGASIVA